jgi:glutaredoxin
VVITLYTTSPCSQCSLTKRWLDSRGIPYTALDANSDPATADAIRAVAEADGVIPNMPYVQVSNGDPETDLHWFGFIPDNLEKYTTTKEEAA